MSTFLLVRQLVRWYDRLAVQMITVQLDMKKNSIWKIITKYLDMGKVCAELRQRQLNDNQKEHCMYVCQNIIDHLPQKPDLFH